MQFYGFLSNCATSALVGPDASIDWLAFPRFDSPAVFCRLLGDDRHGYYRVECDGATLIGQDYLDDTNVIRTTWQGQGGKAVLYDYLAIGRNELRRRIESDLPVRVVILPAFQYGLVAATPEPVSHGAVFHHPLEREALVFSIHGSPHVPSQEIVSQPLEGTWELPPGNYDLILRYLNDDKREGEAAIDDVVRQAKLAEHQLEHEGVNHSLRNTTEFWRDRVAALPQGVYDRALRRSLLVLHGLTFRTTGAIIAAPTTSLPETVGESRQWDYRFAWIRDGSYAAEAFLAAGDTVACRRFLEFLMNCIDLQDKPFQAPFFHVDGTLIRGERELGWLPGFRHSRPCREGNGATHQSQLDVEGDFLWTVYRYWQVSGNTPFIRFYWDVITLLVDWVGKHWNQKDASLWEFRGQDAHYTHSKLMGWVTLYYGAELAEAMEQPATAKRWRAEADRVRGAIESRGFNTGLGHYVQAFDGDQLDAALLLMPLYGYCSATDPRFSATVAAIEQSLRHGVLVNRYLGDMLGTAAHPFLLASFWLARVYLQQGRTDDARAILEGLLGTCTDLGLLGEHVDAETGEPRGNFPQAFSHIGIIMTVLELRAAVEVAARSV